MDRTQANRADRVAEELGAPEDPSTATAGDDRGDEERGPRWVPETEGPVHGVAVSVGSGAAVARPDRAPDDATATDETVEANDSSDPRTR